MNQWFGQSILMLVPIWRLTFSGSVQFSNLLHLYYVAFDYQWVPVRNLWEECINIVGDSGDSSLSDNDEKDVYYNWKFALLSGVSGKWWDTNVKYLWIANMKFVDFCN